MNRAQRGGTSMGCLINLMQMLVPLITRFVQSRRNANRQGTPMGFGGGGGGGFGQQAPGYHPSPGYQPGPGFGPGPGYRPGPGYQPPPGGRPPPGGTAPPGPPPSTCVKGTSVCCMCGIAIIAGAILGYIIYLFVSSSFG